MGLLDADFQALHFAVVLQDVGGNVSGNSLDEVARLALHHQPDVPGRHNIAGSMKALQLCISFIIYAVNAL